MENNVNQRIIMLKKDLGLTDIEFCNKCSVSTGTLFRIKNGEPVSSKVITAISLGLNVNREWLLSETGKKFNETPKAEAVNANPWKDALIAELKEEVNYYRDLLKIMASGKAANFLKVPEYAYNKLVLPNRKTFAIASGTKVC